MLLWHCCCDSVVVTLLWQCCCDTCCCDTVVVTLLLWHFCCDTCCCDTVVVANEQYIYETKKNSAFTFILVFSKPRPKVAISATLRPLQRPFLKFYFSDEIPGWGYSPFFFTFRDMCTVTGLHCTSLSTRCDVALTDLFNEPHSWLAWLVDGLAVVFLYITSRNWRIRTN